MIIHTTEYWILRKILCLLVLFLLLIFVPTNKLRVAIIFFVLLNNYCKIFLSFCLPLSVLFSAFEFSSLSNPQTVTLFSVESNKKVLVILYCTLLGDIFSTWSYYYSSVCNFFHISTFDKPSWDTSITLIQM